MKTDFFALNVRLLGALIVCASVLVVGIHFLHRYQMRRYADFFLDRARVAKTAIDQIEDPAEKLDQWRKASADYGKYFAIQTEDTDAVTEAKAEIALFGADLGNVLSKAGLVYDAQSLYGTSLAGMEEVLRGVPDRKDLRRKLVDILFGLGRYDDALAHLRFLCQIPRNRDELRKLFDRYGLDERLAAANAAPGSGTDGLASLLRSGGDSVDHDKLFKFLGDDFWMLLEDPELLAIFGMSKARLHKREQAVKPIEKSIALAPQTLDTYRALADLLRLLNKPDVADYWMTDMVGTNNDSYRAYWLRGDYRRSLIGEYNGGQAVRMAEDAMADAASSLRKAIQQIHEKASKNASGKASTKELAAAFDAVGKAAPTPGSPVTPDYCQCLIRAAQRAKAVGDALGGTSKELTGVRDALLLAADCSLAWPREELAGVKGRLERARDFATAAVELFPNHAPAYLILAEVEQRAGRPKDAIACLERGRDATDKQQHILWQLAGLLIDAGRLDDAQQTINELGRTGTPEMFLDHLRAHLDFAQGRWLAAINGFTKVRPLLTDWPLEARKVDFLLAECYGKLGRLKDQRDAYLRSAATDRSWLPALLGLAETKVKTGQIDEAIEDYRALLKLPSAPPAARLELARLLYLKNLRLPPSEKNWKEVEQAVDEAERASPGAVGPTVLRAEVLIAKDAVGDAAKLLAGTETQLLQEAKTLTAKRQTVLAEAEKLSGDAKTAKLAEAQRLQAEIQAKQASRPAVWQSMIGMAMNQRNWAAVEQGLGSAAKELGDVPLLRALRAKYLVERYGKDKASDIRQLAENVQAFSPEQQQWLWRALARLSYQAEDYPQTEALCRRVLEKDPGNIETQTLRFQMAARDKDVVAMEKILKEIRDTQATPGAFWYYGEAVRLAAMADKKDTDVNLERAKQSLAKAAELQPSWGQVRLLAGMIAERQHDENAAIEAYLQAIELGTRDPATVRRVAQLLSRRNRYREADRVLRLLGETQSALSDDTRREMRSVKTQLGEFEEAAELARNVAASSDNFEDHIWLGQLLGVVGKQAKNRQQPELAKKALDEAEDALRKAVLLKSDKPEAWVALIQFYGQNDQLDKAEKTIAQAKRKLTPIQAAAALAQCYDVLGQVDQATKEYKSALEIAPTDATVARRAAAFYLQNNQTSKGVAQLTRILEGKVDANEGQKSWARRALGSTLFAQGGDANRRAALGLIEQNLRSDPGSAPDQYVKAVMLAADMSGSRRREAITSLETFLGTQATPEPEIQFTLAQLYLDEADWGKYRTLMRSLLKETRNVRYLQAYAEALMQAGDLDEVQGIVDDLAKLEPNSVGTLRARVEFAFRQRQFEAVVRLLKSWLDRPTDEQSNRESRLPLVAETLEYYARQLREVKQPAVAVQFSKEAQAIYQEYVNLKPNQELLMATFLARQGRLDEALTLAEAKWPSSDPEGVAMACFNLLNGTGATPEQVLRIERLLKMASDKHGTVTPLRIALAVLRDNQGHFDEAEGIYRAILAEEPENATVLNNLAVLLSLHQKNLDEAAELIERAIKTVGPSSGLLDSRAMVRMAQGKPRLALEDLQQSLKDDPSAMTYFHLAQAHQQNGQRTPAIEALKKARSLGLKAEQLRGVERAAYQKLAVTLD